MMPFWLRGAVSSRHLEALESLGSPGRPGERISAVSAQVGEALASVTKLVAESALPGARLVRIVWFTKDETANWGVPWHQDRIIAVSERHDLPGFRNWSRKAGLWHCEPPIELLQQMRFVRLHLDDCNADNGAMRIASGSHVEGMVPDAEAADVASRYPQEVCSAARGDVQILPMLTLHCSEPASVRTPRRAIRLDYAAFELPHPLTWTVHGS